MRKANALASRSLLSHLVYHWCFGKDWMNIARASAWSRRGALEEDPYGNIWDFLRSITADPLEREIGSNRENEFRHVVAIERSSSLTTS